MGNMGRIIRRETVESTILLSGAFCCCTIKQRASNLCLTAAFASARIGANSRFNSTQMDPLSDGSKDY